MGAKVLLAAVASIFAPIFVFARVAKLVDAPGLGPDAGNSVGVRVPPRAPVFTVVDGLRVIH